jgi:hypothetical protein
MSEPTVEELLARLAEKDAENAALKQQLGISQSGSGALAQGPGAAAAGERGVAVAGDFHGNVYVGKPPEDEKQAMAIYRRMLEVSCRRLPLRGVDVGASDPTRDGKQLDLDQVYVNLDTTRSLSAR